MFALVKQLEVSNVNAEFRAVGTSSEFKFTFKQNLNSNFCLNLYLNQKSVPTTRNSAFTLVLSNLDFND